MSQTLKQMADRVDRDLSLNIDDRYGQSLVLREDVYKYLNEGHEFIAREIATKVKEDYFLRLTELDVVAGVSEYSLPKEMFINKVRAVLFGNESGYQKLEEVSFDQYLGYASLRTKDSANPIGYFLSQTGDIPEESEEKSLKTQVKIILLPNANYKEGYHLKVYYIRNPTQLINDEDRPDIVSSEDTLIAYAKYQICLNRDPTLGLSRHTTDFENKMTNLIGSYADRTPEEGGTQLNVDECTIYSALGPAEMY